jgi:hypothetical protein
VDFDLPKTQRRKNEIRSLIVLPQKNWSTTPAPTVSRTHFNKKKGGAFIEVTVMTLRYSLTFYLVLFK